MAGPEPTVPLWLPDARFGRADAPLPPVGEDDDLDPDDDLPEGGFPADVIAALGFDPTTMAQDAAGQWDESKHPRDDDGKFGSGGGGGAKPNPTAAKALSPHTNTKAKPLVTIHQFATAGLTHGHDPLALSKKIIDYTGQYAHPTIASYANKVLTHIEQAHGLPKGALGKAVAKGGAANFPKGATSPANKAASAQKPDDEPDWLGPKDQDQLATMMELIEGGPQHPAALKTKLAQLQQIKDKLPAGSKLHSYADKYIAGMQAKTADEPTKPASPVDSLAQINDIANSDAGLFEKMEQLEATIQKYGPASLMGHLANELLEQYGAELEQESKPLGKMPLAETEPAPAVEGPAPHSASPLQQEIHAIATGPGSAAEKVSQIKNAMAVQMGGFTEQFAKQWIKALGGEAMAPAMLKGDPKAAAKEPHVQAPPKVHQKGVALHADAKKFSSTQDAGGSKVVPSLKKAFWDKTTPSQRLAAKQYVGGGYSDMNTALRQMDEDPGSADPAVVATIAAFDEIFDHPDAKLTEDVVLMRGEQVPAADIAKWKTALAAGLPVRYAKTGFVSTSMAERPAFDKSVWMEITARKGTPALGAHTISPHKNENEVVLQHGQAFEIYEITHSPKFNRTIVRMYTR